MRSPSTSIARELGYLSAPSREEITYGNRGVIIMGPLVGKMTSYHQGPSNKELWKRTREHAECVREEFRL